MGQREAETVLYVSPNGYLGGAEKFLINVTRQHTSNREDFVRGFSSSTTDLPSSSPEPTASMSI